MKVDILNKKRVYDKFFKIDEVQLKHEKYDGTLSDSMTRLCFERGDAVAVLLYDLDLDQFLLVEQFRYPTYEKDTGWISELPAGMLGENESPDQAMRREIKEECGSEVVIDSMDHIMTFYVSPGGTSERIHLFYAEVHDSAVGTLFTGNEDEHEFIKKVFIDAENTAVVNYLFGDQPKDAKTMLAFLWWLGLEEISYCLNS